MIVLHDNFKYYFITEVIIVGSRCADISNKPTLLSYTKVTYFNLENQEVDVRERRRGDKL